MKLKYLNTRFKSLRAPQQENTAYSSLVVTVVETLESSAVQKVMVGLASRRVQASIVLLCNITTDH